VTAEVEQLLLKGQSDINKALLDMAMQLGGLGAEVKNLCDGRGAAQDDHRQCRSEVDGRFDRMDARLVKVETLHEQQAGGVKTAGLFWKILTGVLMAVVAVLAILGGTGVM
jgi:hypothetical protein